MDLQEYVDRRLQKDQAFARAYRREKRRRALRRCWWRIRRRLNR